MMHKPILIRNLTLTFSHKTCFEDFTTQINYGDRIAIIGRNGSGKSTLLNMLRGTIALNSDDIKIPNDVIQGYVPQIIDTFSNLSGAQRFNANLTNALSHNPNVLLLDEPTNHLDQHNRKSLLRMLQNYHGTLIIVSHDRELLRNNVNSLWHINNQKITVFSGNYDDYIHEIQSQRLALEKNIAILNRKKKSMHDDLMQEQQRAAKSKEKGKKSIQQSKWPTVVSAAKASRGEKTSGRKKSEIYCKKQALSEQLKDLQLEEMIIPTFSLTHEEMGMRTLVSIKDGSIAYDINKPFLGNIHFTLHSQDRIAIRGNNGSGKTSLLKGILNDNTIIKKGDWIVPAKEYIGYLDQHYAILPSEKTVLEIINDCVPNWTHSDIRQHLNNFLFRKNEEVNAKVCQLSGGEKIRLCLAQIAAKTPKLLILDEITNNIDLETRQHLINVLKNYPGAIIIISHDEDFLAEINVNNFFEITE